MPVNVDADIRECLDMMIGCLREIQVKLWQEPLEAQQEAIKQMEELDVMEKVISVFREGNYAEARQNRLESELKYLK